MRSPSAPNMPGTIRSTGSASVSTSATWSTPSRTTGTRSGSVRIRCTSEFSPSTRAAPSTSTGSSRTSAGSSLSACSARSAGTANPPVKASSDSDASRTARRFFPAQGRCSATPHRGSWAAAVARSAWPATCVRAVLRSPPARTSPISAWAEVNSSRTVRTFQPSQLPTPISAMRTTASETHGQRRRRLSAEARRGRFSRALDAGEPLVGSSIGTGPIVVSRAT